MTRQRTHSPEQAMPATRTTVSALLALCGLAPLAAAQPGVAWFRTYDGPVRQDDYAVAVAHGPGGTVAVTGVSPGVQTVD